MVHRSFSFVRETGQRASYRILLHSLFCVFPFAASAAPYAYRETAVQEAKAPAGSVELESALARNDFDAAQRIADELIHRNSSDSPLELAALLKSLAQRFYATERPEGAVRAEALFQQALTLLERAYGSSDKTLLDPMAGLADLYFERGRFEEALALDRRALGIRTQELGPLHPEVASAERNLGVSLTRLAYLREGEEHLQRALAIAERSTPANSLETAYTLKELAENLRIQNRYEEALPLLERAVTLAEEELGAEHPELVELLISLSGIYRDLHRFADSQRRHRQAWNAFEKSAERSDILKLALLNNEAEILRFQGDDAHAERVYRETILLSAQVLPDSPRRATFVNQLAELLIRQERFEEAEPLLREALDVRERTLGSAHPELADTYLQLGALYASTHRATMARQAFGKALSLRESRLGAEHPDVAAALVAFAEILESGDEQRTVLDRAIGILRHTPAEPRTLARALSLRSRLAGSDTVKDLTESLDIVERLRPEAGGSELTRSRFLRGYFDDYNRMILLALESGDLSRAFEYSERRRARTLLDQLSSSNVSLRAGIPDGERGTLEARETLLLSRITESRERLRVLQDDGGASEKVETLEKRLSETLDEYTAFYEEIKNASRFWRGQSALADGRLQTMADFQRSTLRPNTMALVFIIGADDSYVMGISPDGASYHRLEVEEADAATLGITPGPLSAPRLSAVLSPSPKTMNPALPEGLVSDLGRPPTLASRNRRLPRQLHALFRALFPAALWKSLRSLEEVVVIPDGSLFQLPFEALVVQDPEESSSDIVYWLDEGPPIRYATSATLLSNLEGRPATRRVEGVQAVSVSNPWYGEASREDRAGSGTILRSLPATARESDALERRFGKARVRVLQGRSATEASVRIALPMASLLHLATHGMVDPGGRSLFASLALAPPPRIISTDDDGRLELREIYELKLDADLAVLSACSTRGGSLIAGEGVFALSRGFLGAGARRVIASLWQVDDESTAELFSALYEQIQPSQAEEAVDYSRALTTAKRRLRSRREWEAPFFWAPFVLDGAH